MEANVLTTKPSHLRWQVMMIMMTMNENDSNVEWCIRSWYFAECLIEALAWGGVDSSVYTGYIAINGNRALSTTVGGYRGFNLVQLDVSSCSSTNIVKYDTYLYTSDSDVMATYINALPLYTVLIGVTADDPQQSLNQNAKDALFAIGVNVAGLQYQGKVCFVAQIGQPGTSVSLIGLSGGNNIKLSVNVTGKVITHSI